MVDGKEMVEFRYTSAHLEEGFPGEVEVTVGYKPTEEAGGRVRLEIELKAELKGGAEETCVNLTNHSYVGFPTLSFGCGC